MKDFIRVLSKMDTLYILKTYSAGEKILKKATTEKLFIKLLKNNRNVVYVNKEFKLKNYLNKHIYNNGVILFMGAGSITKLANDFANN